MFQGIDYEMDEEAFSYITSPFNPYQFEAQVPVVCADLLIGCTGIFLEVQMAKKLTTLSDPLT